MATTYAKKSRATAILACVIIFTAFFISVFCSPLIGLALSISLAVFMVSIFNKEKILYAFAFLYPLLPKGLAVDIGSSLPLITASRVLILYVVFFELCFNRGSFKDVKKKLYSSKFNLIFALYFLTCIINYFVYANVESFKIMISIAIEYIFVTFFIYFRISSNEEAEKFLDALLLSAFLIGISGIVEFFFGNSVFRFLNIVKTDRILMTGEGAVRLGVRRVEGPFGHPLAYCNFLLLIIPFALYKVLQFKEKRVKNLIVLTVLVINFILTLSRGPMLAFLGGFAVFFLFANKKEKIIIAVGSFFSFELLGVAAVSGVLPLFLRNFFISVVDAVFMTNTVSNFGGNRYAHQYRLYLFELAGKLVSGNKLFWGNGMGYFRLNQVFDYVPFISTTKPILIRSIDNHYLLKYIEMGLSGLVMTILIALAPIVSCIKSIRNSEHRYFYLCVLFSIAAYFINLFTVDEVSTLRFYWIIIGAVNFKLYIDRASETK